jgi:hypothetical protein
MLEVASVRSALPTAITVLAWAKGWATLVALTVTVCVRAALATGAVNRPSSEIVPALAHQVTAGLLTLLTVALNLIFPPLAVVGVAGVISTLAQESHESIAIV